jgi:flagellin
MAQVINTNVLSLNAQRNLSTSQSSLATALQRLSSGLRINSAKDDAAGLAISDRFTTQIRGLNQAARNASDGISLAQTGESALAELTNNLQRIRELAVQAANSTNSASDRAALDLEVQQRLAEVERVATQTSFNGQKVLDGNFGGATFQVGANVGETISLDLSTSMRRSDIGEVATATSLAGLRATIEGAPAIATTTGAISVTATGSVSGTTTAPAVYTLTVDGNTLYTNTIATGATSSSLVTGAALDAAWGTFASANAGYTLTGSFAAGTAIISKTDGTDMVIASGVTGGTGGTVVAPTFGGGAVATHTNGTAAVAAAPLAITDLTIQVGDADAVTVADGSYTTMQGLVDAVNTALAGAATATLNSETGVMTINSNETISIGGANQGSVFTAASYVAAGSLGTANVLDIAGANDTISRVDSALTEVSTLRSTFGAIQNRFESTIANLQAVSENLEASRSRILDADFAAETAALTKAQILQQAGIAILAQANGQPQSVLALLQ